MYPRLHKRVFNLEFQIDRQVPTPIEPCEVVGRNTNLKPLSCWKCLSSKYLGTYVTMNIFNTTIPSESLNEYILIESQGVVLYRSLLPLHLCCPQACVRYAPCGISPGGCPVPVGGQTPFPRFTFAPSIPNNLRSCFSYPDFWPLSLPFISHYAITRRHKVKRDTRRERGCGDSLLTRTVKNPWCSSLRVG